MPETALNANKRRQRQDEEQFSAGEEGAPPPARRRRTFLHTMGRQLRELGTDGTSPQDRSRATFGTSPMGQSTLNTNTQGETCSEDRAGSGREESIGEDDQLPSGTGKSSSEWLWKSQEVEFTMTPPTAAAFSFEDLLDWSQCYFDLWHPAFPFIHAPSMIEYFHKIERKPLLPAATEIEVFQGVITRSIISIATMDRRHMNLTPASPLPSHLVFHSFNDAIESVHKVLTLESSIHSLQALVSVVIFLITMQRYNAASRLESLAVRLLFQLNLHKCPFKMTGSARAEANLRKRLFWSMFCLDRYVCIRLGTPVGIRSEDVDVCHLHDELHLAQGHKNTEHDSRLDFLDFLARHASIRGSIMELRNSSSLNRHVAGSNQTLNIEIEHSKWWNTVDEYLSNVELTQAPAITKAHQVTLIVLRFESILALWRSVLATPNQGPAYDAALQRCISASRSIINTLYKALQGFGAFDGSPGRHGYQTTPLLWPSFTWAVWMSTFIIIFAATEDEVPRTVAKSLATRSISILQHLALRNTKWPEACIVAIRKLLDRIDGGGSSRTDGPEMTSTQSRQPVRPMGNPTDPSARPNETSVPNQSLYRASNDIVSTYPLHGMSVSNSQYHPVQQSYHVTTDTAYNPISSIDMDAFGVIPSVTGSSTANQVQNLASSHLGGSGTFLGIAQEMSDNPLSTNEIMHLFNNTDERAPWFNEANYL
ncbi:hypothetical protein BU24DRAFT_140937 [Aaosphaeria arxii CBS 175.79]|uniref:Xylanolytic transcriptional activator regulatory domain-containing protein n=1 Tax=Aaosphaeria arxii CBS 175.79 TaxID=1450172 RepID=A0A6A5XW54_9PLEO|nr:uncharacterized protein BU24DRAFT_140937 [Aaosphaeria arxii CBS 175.79]KAF2016941.1 hypothetical protein BU24DRAFT_140937 [Aaosphaeria arxii CBS 175.79]